MTRAQREKAIADLISAENSFLLAFGWSGPDNDGNWKPPPGYLTDKGIPPGEEHTRDRGHAINSQKHRIFSYGGISLESAIREGLDLSGDPAHDTAAGGEPVPARGDQ